MSGVGSPAEAVRVALQLALGREVEQSPQTDWARVHDAARVERLAALAWRRSGAQIRRYAPAEVIALWRAESVAAGELASRQLNALRDIASATERDGRSPLVLKGVPLADRLYDDLTVRVSCDIDLFVPAEDRSRAHRMLTGLGWQHWYGTSPFDASYRRTDGTATLFLEVHSLLSSDVLAHLHLGGTSQKRWSHDGLSVNTLDGATLAVYLAVNLAKHGMPPLLSYLDLATLWAGLDEQDRKKAYQLAADARLGRCLRWALARAAALPAAAQGQPTALQTLGFQRNGRTSTHAFLRLMLLADRPGDAVRILGAWAWPRSLRETRGAIVPFWSRRLQRSFAGRFRYTRSYASNPSART